ncbi:MAG: oligosaccharide flippase family protein [Actinobacteria bacterium]|nr:oligosaccharide flippase family protein [Actinomycetota bacterium]
MSKLSKNITYNFFGQGLLMVLGFVAVKYIFKQLGEDALGIIYFTSAMNVVLTGVLNKGIYATTVREVSAHFNDEPGYICDFIRTGSLFTWGVYVFFGAGVYFGAPILVEKWINLKTMDSATATSILQILGITSLIAFPSSFYASLLRGLQRMEFNNFIDVASSGLRQFGTILILTSGGNLFHVVYWFALCYGLSILAYFTISSRFFSILSFLPGYSSSVVKRNRSFTLKMTYISILAMIHNNAEKIIISKWLSIGVFGYYGFAYSVASKGGLITGAIAQAAFPSLSALVKAGDRVSLMSQYRKLQDLICFITIPIFAAVIFATLPLFTYLFNEEIAKTLLFPVTFLSLGFYMNGTLNLPYQFSLAVGKPEITVRSATYALFIVLPVTALLIYQFGLAGAGLSWLLYNLFVYAYAVPRICNECMEISVWTWYSHVLKVYILASLTYGIAWIVLEFLDIYSILSLSITYTGATIIFLTGAYFMISDELRETLLKYIQILRNNPKFKPIANINK